MNHPMRTLAGLLMTAAALAADRTPLGPEYLRQHALTRGFLLGRPVKPKPTPDGKSVLFLRGEARSPKLKLYEFDLASQQTRELLSPDTILKGAEESLTPEEKARRERQRVSAAGFADYQISDDGQRILVSLSGKLYLLERGSGAIRELATPPGTIIDPKFSPDGQRIGYVRDHDVSVYDLATNREQPITTGGTPSKTHGLAEFVAQEEMSRFSGWWWSPDGQSIAYAEADATGVEEWYVADPSKPGQAPHPQYYPRPGHNNVSVRLGIVPVAGGETVWVDWDRKAYPYLGSVRWDKHGPLTITVQDRKQQEQILLRVDPANGSTHALIHERDSAFVNLRQDVPRWISAGEFLWLTDTGPKPGLQRRKATGDITHVIPGVRDLVHANDSRILVVTGTEPGSNHLQRLSPTGESFTFTTLPDGVHAASAGNGGELLVVTTTTPTALPTTRVLRADGTVVGELPSVAETPDFTPNVEFLKVGAGDGYYAAIVRPHGFDPAKRYPVIVDVYGGPHHLTVVKAMRNWLLDQWLADQGFVVVAVENRGTPNRGRDWERAVYQKFGQVPLDDQVAGLQALGKKFPFLDLDRVGIVGWSFGGYMSGLAVLKRPDIYKAAVAGAPVTDWEDYDTHYTERYMGLLPESAAAYREASLLTYADQLTRPLLLVHGTADDNVFFRHTLRLAEALFRAGKEFDLLPLSGLTHMVPDPVVTERLWTRVAGHFQRHLGGPK
jgi:dipeptidyl-peptidase-4